MKVLNVAVSDWANYSYCNAAALRSVGVDAVSVKIQPHVFGYDKQCKVCLDAEIKAAIDKATIVQLMHSNDRYLKYAKSKGKRVFVYHTGTNYRNNPAGMNTIFNPYVEAAFTDQTEFIGLGMKNQQYVPVAIDVAKYPRNYYEGGRLKIAHFPSNAEVKGTEEIVKMISGLEGDFDFLYSTDNVDNKAQVARMDACDIYVELFKPYLNGKVYGCYGVTAFEAVALGKIVITQNMRTWVYKKFYGDCPLVIANNETDFVDHIKRLINTPQLEIIQMQRNAREWIVQKHSFEATGKRLKNLLGIK
jgi:glycosyltransferase involved in cell wall biosynthesis